MTGRITVFGGTGFIGRHLVALLLRSGATVRVAVRHPSRVPVATESRQAPELIQADALDDISIGDAIAGADAVINLVGISDRDVSIRPFFPPDPDPDDPYVDEKRQTVTYTIDRIAHHSSHHLRPFFLQLDPQREPTRFGCHVKMVADEIPDPIVDDLIFDFSVGDG